MNNEKMRFKIKTGIDRHCAVLSPDPDRVQRVLHAAHKEGKTVVQKKTPRGLVLLLILTLIGLAALAAALLWRDYVL